MRKLEALRDAQVPLPKSALFDLIAHTSPKIDRRRNGLFDNPWLSAVRGGAACLANTGSERAVDAVMRLGSIEELEEYVVDVVGFLKPQDADSTSERLPAGYDFSSVGRAASAVIRASLEAHAASSPLDDGAMTNFWTWRHLDSDAAKAWLVGQVETGRWTMAETMGAFTSTLVPVGVPNPAPSIGDFEIRAVDEIFGLNHVFAELGSVLDAATAPSGGSFRTPATPENRVQHALLRLKQERDTRTATGDQPG